jgi:hypothetical protein
MTGSTEYVLKLCMENSRGSNVYDENQSHLVAGEDSINYKLN